MLNFVSRFKISPLKAKQRRRDLQKMHCCYGFNLGLLGMCLVVLVQLF